MGHHAHRQIREAIAAALGNLPTTGAHVHTNRLRPISTATALRIFIGQEEAEDLSVDDPVAQHRHPELIVECCAKEAADVDDVLDQISLEVETVLAAAIVVGGKRLLLSYAGMQLDQELSDKPVGIKRLRFAINYTAMSNAPDQLT
jgi:hypothetical protein